MKCISARLRGDNRGSGLITVLVAMLFIAALGATLLFVSYTGLQVKLAGRSGTENFYGAESAMSDVRIGVQNAVTKALAASYTEVLQNYAKLTKDYEIADKSKFPSLEDYLENGFHGFFVAELKNDALFDNSGNYKPATLQTYITPSAGVTAVLTGSGVCSKTADAFTLNGITLAYTDAKGFGTNLSTDITIKLPPFTYAPPGYSHTGMNLYSVIAKDGIYASTGNYALSGNAYGGGVYVNGGKLSFSDGTLTCGGDLSIDTGAQFNMMANATAKRAALWADSVTLDGNKSIANLSGDVYVADDLALNGAGASATLSGSYCGFGYTDNALADTAAHSSSILINGRKTKLDMSGLNSLMLAGCGFINTGDADYAMGQSVAARSDQLAYLVPSSCLPVGAATNPCLTKTPFDATYSEDIMAGIKKLKQPYYKNVSGAKAVYVALSGSNSGEQIVYFFLTFKNQTDANAYFKGYFDENKSEISSYLKVYSDYYRSTNSVSSSGNVYSGSLGTPAPDNIGLAQGSGDLRLLAGSYSSQFNNRRVTLSDVKAPPVGVTNPYDYFVNKAAVTAVTGGGTEPAEFTDASGTVLAIVVNGDYTYIKDGTEKIIIATGNVTVPPTGFSGLIIAGKSVIMNGNISADASAVASAMNATCNGRTLLSCLNDGSNTGSVGGSSNDGLSWNLEDLVKYSNWKKS
ncbi:MAG: hypothetical protein RR230_01920 [Oscillospiraceae bacterium]